MNNFEAFYKEQAERALNHMEAGYLAYARKLYKTLISLLEDELLEEGSADKFEPGFLPSVLTEMVSLKDKGFLETHNYFFCRSNVVKNYVYASDPRSEVSTMWKRENFKTCSKKPSASL